MQTYDADFDLIFVFFSVYGSGAHEKHEQEWADENPIEEQSGTYGLLCLLLFLWIGSSSLVFYVRGANW